MWAHDLLGIDPDADERAVRRAYAALLKRTRPEDDPEAFQRLVRARDLALERARSRPAVESESHRSDADAGLSAPSSQALGTTATSPSPPDGSRAETAPEPGPETVGTVEDRLPPPAVPLAGSSAGPDVGSTVGPPPDAAPASSPTVGPVTMADYLALGLATTATRDEIEAAFRTVAGRFGPDDAGEAGRLEAARDRILAVTPPGRTGGAGRDPGGSGTGATAAPSLRDRLYDLLQRPAPYADEAAWRALIEEVEALDISRRLDFESRIALSIDGTLRSPGESEDEGHPPEDALPVLRRLDEVFGWSADVRRLARMLGPDAENRPLVLAVEGIGSPLVPPRRGEDGFPLIEPFDLEAYAGADDPGLQRYYETARREGRFRLSWSWMAVFFPAWWLARRGYGLAAGLSVGGLVVLIAGFFEPLPTAKAARDLVSFLILLTGLRFALALTSRRIEILRLARLVDVADAETPGRNDRRRQFLREHRRVGRLSAFLFSAAFLLLVDLYAAGTLVGALRLSPEIVKAHVAPEVAGSLYERVRVRSYLDHRRRTLAHVEEAVRDALGGASPAEQVRLAAFRAEATDELQRASIAEYWALAALWRQRADKLAGSRPPT